ncbi:hypothetical protein DRE_07525 [Drechslerella stenobrocha 248]|uniref:BHLH domain-containing protein n=1 Tax=Drechslerella stenobrocha 248 TaxID=1043628 RepID=W7HUG7_9PEZI|nr:hypothetical protein DRE_07525 [Drechslerella stenobrocha 248]
MSGDISQPLWPNGMPGGDDDFADFLDLDFNMNFGQFDMDTDSPPPPLPPTQQAQLQAQLQQSGGGDDIAMGNFPGMQHNLDFNGVNPPPPQSLQRQMQMQRQVAVSQNLGLATLYEHPHALPGMYAGRSIPPTPSSLELHAGVHGMSNFLKQGNLYPNLGPDPIVFTPIVSPAVTPLDTSFRVPEYSVSGAYFSPLTSPALDAQALGYMQRKIPKSPVEPPESSSLNPKKTATRRKSLNGRMPARVVRQSPSMKPQPGRRKAAPVVPSLELTDAAMAEIVSQSPRTPTSRRAFRVTPTESNMLSSRGSSSADSISPEPLSESLMPPPPAPSGSNAKSPLQRNQESNLPSPVQSKLPTIPAEAALPAQPGKGGKPATPSSLMNMPKGLAPNGSAQSLQGIIVPSVTEKQASSGTTTPLEDQTTPRLSAVQRSSANVTPSSSPMIEPAPAGTESRPPSGSLKPRKDAKSHSKRGSISASPALQPRISPGIKPLLPEGLSVAQSALILASKSNYEHIVSGNHNQLGLSYPEHLATNLTHKRTSHKIAEQGRRNRINNALAEISTLLPQRAPDKGGDSGAQAGSKANTVELAIEYIKELKSSLAEATAKLAAAEAKLAALDLNKGASTDDKPTASAVTAPVNNEGEPNKSAAVADAEAGARA